MPKRRKPVSGAVIEEDRPQVKPEAIEQFAAGADSDEDIVKGAAPSQLEPVIREIIEPEPEVEQAPDPLANHDYKAIRVPMNRYYFELLEQGARNERRSKLEFMRLAIEKATTEGL